MKVEEYLTEEGLSPFKKWFESLDSTSAAKIAVALLKLELGNTSNIKWFDGIGEYKIDWGPGYRIYLIMQGNKLIILFGGGTKKTQKKDIVKAKELFNEFKERKKKERK